MKFRYKRFLFYVLRTISVAGLVGMTAVVVLSAIGKLPDFPLTDVQAWLLELLLIFSNHFDIRYNANRKKTREFFRDNQPLLEQALCDLSDKPVLRIEMNRNAMLKKAPNAIQENGLYIVPDTAATEEALNSAAMTAAKLVDGLKQRENASYPDYSDNTLQLRIRKRSRRVWTVQVRSAAIGFRQTLFFSPDGNTRELDRAAFFPPRALTESWFV